MQLAGFFSRIRCVQQVCKLAKLSKFLLVCGHLPSFSFWLVPPPPWVKAHTAGPPRGGIQIGFSPLLSTVLFGPTIASGETKKTFFSFFSSIFFFQSRFPPPFLCVKLREARREISTRRKRTRCVKEYGSETPHKSSY